MFSDAGLSVDTTNLCSTFVRIRKRHPLSWWMNFEESNPSLSPLPQVSAALLQGTWSDKWDMC